MDGSDPTDSSQPDLSVVVLSWNTQDYLRECLQALRLATDGMSCEVVVIDNGSADGSADMVAREFPETRLHRNPVNRGYAGGVNQGLSLATGRKLCLLGSDTRVRPGTFRALVDFLDTHPQVGAVAPPLLNEDGSYQKACARFPTLRTAAFWDTPLQQLWPDAPVLQRYLMQDWDHHGTRAVDQPPGTCLMFPRHVYRIVGGMDESLWLFFNDVDWALRVRRAGYQIWYVDCGGVYHHQGGSTRRYLDFAVEWHKNRIRYYRKHHHFPGHVLTKGVAAYVALRQCVRVKRDLPFGREYWAHCRILVGKMWEALRA